MSYSDHHNAPRGTVRPRAPELPTTPSRQDVFASSPGNTPARKRLTTTKPDEYGFPGSKLWILEPDRGPSPHTTLALPDPEEGKEPRLWTPPNSKARQILADWYKTAWLLDDVVDVVRSQHWTTGDLDVIQDLHTPAKELYRYLRRLRRRAGIVETDDDDDDVAITADPGAAVTPLPPPARSAIPAAPETPTKSNQTAQQLQELAASCHDDLQTTPKAARPAQLPSAQPAPAASPPGHAPPSVIERGPHGDAPPAEQKKIRPNEVRRSRSRQATDRTRARVVNTHAVPPSKTRSRRSGNRLVCTFADPAAGQHGRSRPHPASLVAAVNRALPVPLVSAVDYSRTGRLVLLTTDPVRASQLLPHEDHIRRALREVFKLGKDSNIVLEPDVEWTRVVVQNAPLPLGAGQDGFWSGLCAAAGLDSTVVKLRRFLCSRDELDRRMRDSSATNGQAVSVILAISDPKAAARVLRSDVLWQGSVCRTSLYRARSPPSS